MSHTPGPWEEDLSADGEHMARMIAANRDWGAVATVSEDYGHVAYCHYSNASLIAAAPELLQACKDLRACLEDWVGIAEEDDERDYDYEALASAEAAIAKAEGRSE